MPTEMFEFVFFLKQFLTDAMCVCAFFVSRPGLYTPKIQHFPALKTDMLFWGFFSGVNGEVFYKLSERSKEEHGDRFGIEAETGDLYLRSSLDYEVEQEYYLTITAQDQGPNSLPAYAKVIIHVADVNDHTPEITVNSLTPSGLVQVEEGSPEGTFVAHISVVDLDAGRSGEVRCSMDSYEFRLEQLYQTEYKIVTTAIFDREVKSVYHLRIVCEDRGVPIQAASKHVVVTVIDANDNAPRFEKPVYIAQVWKGQFFLLTSSEHLCQLLKSPDKC